MIDFTTLLKVVKLEIRIIFSKNKIELINKVEMFYV